MEMIKWKKICNEDNKNDCAANDNVTAFALGCVRKLITTGTEKSKRAENVVWKRPQKG